MQTEALARLALPQLTMPSHGASKVPPGFNAIGAPDSAALYQAQVKVMGITLLVYLIQVDRTGSGWQTFDAASTFDDRDYSSLLDFLGDESEFEVISIHSRDYILIAVPAQVREN